MLCDVSGIIFSYALMEQLLLMAGQAALAFPIRSCVPSVDAKVAVFLGVDSADVELV